MTRTPLLLGLLFIVSCTATQSITSPSPSPTVATPIASVTATPAPTTPATTAPAPTVNPNPCIAGSDNPACLPDTFVDRLAAALEASDYVALRSLISPAGFFYQRYQTGGTAPITPDQTIARLQSTTNAPDGKVHATVQRRPILPHAEFQPTCDRYVASTWTQYDTLASQRVELLLKSEAGTWYWCGALFNAPTR